MKDYSELLKEYGQVTNATLDHPVRFLGVWEIADALLGIMIICIFGFAFQAWLLALPLALLSIALVPVLKLRNRRGILAHLLYRYGGQDLPGLKHPGHEGKVFGI